MAGSPSLSPFDDLSFLQRVLAASPDCIKVLNLDGDLVAMNENGQKVLELDDLTPHLGTCWTDWWHGAERVLAEAAVATAKAGGVGRFEAAAQTFKGTLKWWDVTVTAIPGRDGEPERLLSVSRDVTAQHTSRDAAAERLERLKSVIESAKDYAVISVDPAGVIDGWSTGAAGVFGWTEPEAVGRPFELIWTPEDVGAGSPKRELTIAAEVGLCPDDRWHVRADGRRIFVVGACRPVHNAGGTLTGFVKVCRDETDARSTEQVLADARRRSEAAMLAGEVGTFTWDIGEDRLYGDTNFARLFDLRLDDGGALPLADYLAAVHPDDRAATQAKMAQTVASGEPYEAEYRIVQADAERWVVARGRVEHDDAGRAVRFPGVILDITARKRAEAALHAGTERYRLLFETIDEGFCVIEMLFDPVGRPVDYRFREFNAAFTRFTGISAEDALGGRTAKEAYPTLEDYWFQAYGRVAATGESIHFENHAEAMEKWFEVTAFRIGGPGSVEVGVLFKDVTERRRAEAERERLAEQRRQALDAADLGWWHVDPASGLVIWDERAKAIFGVTDDRVAFDDAVQHIHPDDRARVSDAVAAATRPHDPQRYAIEYRTLHADGTIRWVRAQGRAYFTGDGAARQFTSFVGTFEDITDERLAADALQAERANLAAIVEKAPAFICTLRGPDHVFELANQGYYRVVGRTDVIGKPVREALPEVEGQGFFEMLDQVYRTGESVSGNEVGVTVGPEGSPDRDRVVNFVYQALRGADGSVSGIFVHGVDVTEMVRSRDVIADSERRRRMALDAARLGAFNMDGPTHVMEADHRLCEIFGITDGPPTFERIAAAIHPDDRRRVSAAVADVTRPDAVSPDYEMEHRVLHADGSTRWVFARGRATFAGAGTDRRLLSFDGTVADVTERKRAESELAFERHQLELIFRDSPAAMALWRGDDLVFEKVNPQYQDYFRGRELVGRPLVKALPELADQSFPDLLRDVLHTGRPYVGHEMLARMASVAGGPIEDRYYDFSYLQVVDPQGRPWGVYDHAVDVTERVLARQALEKSQDLLKRALAERESLLDSERAARAEAEQAGRMKDEFLATLSHELRTPLNAIVGWTQILQAGVDGPDDLAQGLAVIDRNARAQTQIIEDILDMSRIVSGKLRLDVQRLDLGTLVNAGADTVRPAADAKGVRLQVLTDPAAGNVSGDPGRLHQVFWNLVSNAVKFTPKGGRVQVVLERVNSHVEVSVIDTGEGIAPEFLPHVFDRFRQADASTTRKHGGLGLGLAIVKQLVELHGGSVRVKSPGKGQGATFIVALPLTVIHAEPDGPTTPREHPASEVPLDLQQTACDQLRGVTVVAVDDEPDGVAIIDRLLTACGATVRTATSAADALALIRADPPTVLVSDIGMPGEDGYTLIRNVRALPPGGGGRVYALALTAYARAADRVRALEAGFQMHLAKPVDPAELIVSVAALASTPGAK